MIVVYMKATYEELGAPAAGREGGHPLTIVSRDDALTFDAVTQATLVIDEAVNEALCADLMQRAGAYWIDGAGGLNVDPNWTEES